MASLVTCLWALFSSAAMASQALDAATEASQAYQQAIAALQAEQWPQAELLLERSLMLDPDHAEARIELAGLLSQRGRSEAAQVLIDSLIDDPRTPALHRERLLVLRASASRMPELPAARQEPSAVWAADSFVSWSRNPLARSEARELTLTLPEGDVTLPLTQIVRPAATVGLALQRSQPGGLLVDASAQRIGGEEHWQAGRLALAGPLPGLPPLPDGNPPQAGWIWQSRHGFDGVDRHSIGLSLERQDWRLMAGGFVEPALGRQGQQMLAELSLVQQPRWQVQVFVDTEHASHGAPGYLRLGAAAAWVMAPQWLALAQASTQRDWRSYSPWLQNGAPRVMQTTYLALEKQWQPAGQPWQLAVRAHLGQRWSNLSLFGYRDAGLQLSWRHHW